MKMWGIRLNEVVDELDHNFEAKGKQLEIRLGRLNIRFTFYTKIY